MGVGRVKKKNKMRTRERWEDVEELEVEGGSKVYGKRKEKKIIF